MSLNINNILSKYKQQHLLKYKDTLSNQELESLYSQIQNIDWSFLNYLNTSVNYNANISPIDTLGLDDISKHYDIYKTVGLNTIRNNKLALLLLAGGQGTRLGFNKPKGTFNIGINKDLFIFQLLIEHALDVIKEADTWVHLYIMTSDINHNDTVNFLNPTITSVIKKILYIFLYKN